MAQICLVIGDDICRTRVILHTRCLWHLAALAVALGGFLILSSLKVALYICLCSFLRMFCITACVPVFSSFHWYRSHSQHSEGSGGYFSLFLVSSQYVLSRICELLNHVSALGISRARVGVPHGRSDVLAGHVDCPIVKYGV